MVMGFYKWLFMLLIPAGIYMGGKSHEKISGFSEGLFEGDTHPLHVSVTEINHNGTDKTLEISCKLFTDDFEKVLTQNYKTKVDLINPPDRPAMDKLVSDFIQKHLTIKVDGKAAQFSYLGYERDSDVIYSYFQVDNITSVKKMEITNHLMHELFTDQINLVHVIVNGKRKSIKLDYPEKETMMNF
jgi:hypothetical protein